MVEMWCEPTVRAGSCKSHVERYTEDCHLCEGEPVVNILNFNCRPNFSVNEVTKRCSILCLCDVGHDRLQGDLIDYFEVLVLISRRYR